MGHNDNFMKAIASAKKMEAKHKASKLKFDREMKDLRTAKRVLRKL